ncbi:MAG: hypothetical protein AB1Z98_02460, partial [Nannocystaceae bacterium]
MATNDRLPDASPSTDAAAHPDALEPRRDGAAAHPVALDPWREGARIGRQLGAWAAASVALGALLLAVSDDVVVRAFAVQCLVWGAIDGLIA